MTDRLGHRPARRNRFAPEVLEDRRLPASLASIAGLHVPSQQGYALPLDGSGSAEDQTFTITQTSHNPDIVASIPQGHFLTMDVSYTNASDTTKNFNGTLVFQLFGDLTPNTVKQIEQYVTDGYYAGTGQAIARIADLTGSGGYILQGGAPNGNIAAPSGQPGTPFLNENLQQLAFTGSYQLAMANAGVQASYPNPDKGVNSDDTQYFITTSPLNGPLGYGYTIFGQLVSGKSTVDNMADSNKVPLSPDSNTGKNTKPVGLVISSMSISQTNPDGVALIDTTQAKPGETATFQVTAKDADGNTVSRSFTVTVDPYDGQTYPAIDFKPFASPVTATVAQDGSTPVTLTGQPGYPASNYQGTLSYAIGQQPAHGTIQNFDATTGKFTYVPNAGYSGTDTFQYQVQENGPAPPTAWNPYTGQPTNFGPAVTTSSNPTAVTIKVTPTPTSPTPTSPTPTSPTPSPTPASVTLLGVTDTTRGRRATAVTLNLSGAIDAASASNAANYRLLRGNRRHRFVANKRSMIPIKAATYDPATHRVTLIPRRPFPTQKPVEVIIQGGPLAGQTEILE